MSNYLQRDAQFVRECLPEGTVVPANSDALFLMYAVLMRAKGEHTDASDVHDAWSAWMTSTTPDHKSIKPFVKLDAAIREEDIPFLKAIHGAAIKRSCEE